MGSSLLCQASCDNPPFEGPPRLIVVTGGPGAGKTALLEIVRRRLCHHVAILPEAAGIIYGGGFPRHDGLPARRAAQRAIFRVQRELERLAIEEDRVSAVLCDRGSLDGTAYWPGEPEALLAEVGTSFAEELARYAAVIHLEPPPAQNGYNHQNPLRIETAEQAAEIDRRIARAWRDHPRVHEVAHALDFMDKVARALAFVAAELPGACRVHLRDVPLRAVGG